MNQPFGGTPIDGNPYVCIYIYYTYIHTYIHLLQQEGLILTLRADDFGGIWPGTRKSRTSHGFPWLFQMGISESNLPHLENSHLENLTLGFRNSEVRLRQSILPHTHTLSVPYHFPQIQRELQRLQQKKDLLRDRGLPWQWVLVGCFKEVVVEDTTWAKNDRKERPRNKPQTHIPSDIEIYKAPMLGSTRTRGLLSFWSRVRTSILMMKAPAISGKHVFLSEETPKSPKSDGSKPHFSPHTQGHKIGTNLSIWDKPMLDQLGRRKMCNFMERIFALTTRSCFCGWILFQATPSKNSSAARVDCQPWWGQSSEEEDELTHLGGEVSKAGLHVDFTNRHCEFNIV